MKILSWNINGIRAVIRKGFLYFLKKEKPDVLLLQEIKISDKDILKEKFDFLNYTEYWNSAERPGYSGTAILIKNNLNVKPINVSNGIRQKIFDSEGRIQTLEFKKYFLINTYFPHANHELTRLGFKIKFNQAITKYLNKLQKIKPVIIGGDFNVAHQDIDLARPKDNVGNPGFTDEERKWMSGFLKNNFIDTYRYINKDKIQYSWWSYRFDVRARNIGWRIDYLCVSNKIVKNVKKAFILDKILGSDHCPVGIEIKQ